MRQTYQQRVRKNNVPKKKFAIFFSIFVWLENLQKKKSIFIEKQRAVNKKKTWKQKKNQGP